MMKIASWNVYFFLAVLFLAGYAAFLVLQPFLTAILVAAVLGVLFSGLYRRFLRWTGDRPGTSASLTLVVIILLVVVPIIVLSFSALSEANRLYENVGDGTASWGGVINQWAEAVDSTPLWHHLADGRKVQDLFGLDSFLNSFRDVSGSLLSFLQALYQGVASFLFWIFTLFFALFYFLIDGKRAVRYLMRISPLRDEHEKIVIDEFVSMSRATIKGTIAMAFLQGFLGGVIFAVLGIQSPVLWGVTMGFASLVPVFGSGAIWFPAAVILLLSGHLWKGVTLLVFGFGIISTLDNLLRPRLVGRDAQMHPLIVLFATLGGLSLFGFVGFLIGPIIVALFMALLKIYEIEFKSQLDRLNR